MPISLNILGQSVHDRSRLVEWFTAARPPWAVVMDELDTAARVRMASPNTRIVFRRYRPDDHKLAEVMTPAQFLLSVADVPRSYWVQVGNEPNGDQRTLVQWTAELIALANTQNRRLAVGNWSVGNPDDRAVEFGEYDAIMRGLAGSQHILGVHEYFSDDPLTEPFHIGRLRSFLRRADKLGIARPQIVVLEHGRDLGGGAGDGWRGQGWSEADYAARLEAAQDVYRADGITACVFSYGAGFGWDSFNVEGATELLARMARMNAQEVDEVVPGYVKLQTVNNANVRLRAAPGLSAQTLAVLSPGVWVKFLPNAPVVKDGYTWLMCAVDKDAQTHMHGWCAAEVLQR